MAKNYCSVHHLFYSGNECPLCRSERVNAYTKKYEKKEPSKTLKCDGGDRGITKEDVNKLLEKFNTRKR